MAQITARTIEDFLFWIETNRHHIVDATDNDYVIFKGYDGQVRVSSKLLRKHPTLWETSRDPFDSRMYRATKSGKGRLRELNLMKRVLEIQRHTAPNYISAPK